MHKISSLYNLYFLRAVKSLAFIILGVSIIGLSAAVISMLLGAPIGDDYGAISTFKADGNWPHEAMKSLAETGRYGQSIAASVLYGALGNHIVILLPVVVTAWFALLCYLYAQKFIRPLVNNQLTLALCAMTTSILLTFLVLFINNAPKTTNLIVWVSYQSFFWPSGIITYTLPLLVFLSGIYLLFLSSLSKRISHRTQIIYFTLLTLVTSLFNEVQPLTLLAVSFGLFALSYFKAYKHVRPYRYVLTTAIATSAIGLMGLFFAPGRAQRSKVLETITPSSDGSLIESVGRNITLLTRELYLRPREIVLLVTIGLLATVVLHYLAKNKKTYAIYTKSALPYAFALVVVCALSVVVSTALIAVGYGYNAGVYVRTMLISQITYVISLPFLVFTLSSVLVRKYGLNNIFKSVLLLFGLAVLISIPKYLDKILTQVSSSATYHAAWLEQDHLLRTAASNNTPETVYLSDPAAGIGDGFSLQCTGPFAKSTMWLNVQMTQYYGNQDRICPEIDRLLDQKDNEKWVNQ